MSGSPPVQRFRGLPECICQRGQGGNLEVDAALRLSPKYIAIIQQLYEDANCQIIHEEKLTDPLQVQTGVRQGCILPPTIFLLVVD